MNSAIVCSLPYIADGGAVVFIMATLLWMGLYKVSVEDRALLQEAYNLPVGTEKQREMEAGKIGKCVQFSCYKADN